MKKVLREETLEDVLVSAGICKSGSVENIVKNIDFSTYLELQELAKAGKTDEIKARLKVSESVDGNLLLEFMPALGAGALASGAVNAVRTGAQAVGNAVKAGAAGLQGLSAQAAGVIGNNAMGAANAVQNSTEVDPAKLADIYNSTANSTQAQPQQPQQPQQAPQSTSNSYTSAKNNIAQQQQTQQQTNQVNKPMNPVSMTAGGTTANSVMVPGDTFVGKVDAQKRLVVEPDKVAGTEQETAQTNEEVRRMQELAGILVDDVDLDEEARKNPYPTMTTLSSLGQSGHTTPKGFAKQLKKKQKPGRKPRPK